MQYRDDDKARAARFQLELCQRMAKGASDPAMAERLLNLAERLKKQQAAVENQGVDPKKLPNSSKRYGADLPLRTGVPASSALRAVVARSISW